MNKTKSKKVKSVKRGRRSMKGKWGNVGAPPKSVKWPKGPFTMAKLFNQNSKGGNGQCELSLRTKVADGVADGSILTLMTKKQPGGAVGRPKSVFVRKENFIPSKHELAPKTISKLNRTVSVTPAPAAVAPTQVAVPASPAPIEAPASPAPVIVEAPAVLDVPPVIATYVAPVASPASPEPAIG
jgi:hypothetical protein